MGPNASWMLTCWTSDHPLRCGALCTDGQKPWMYQNQGADMSYVCGKKGCLSLVEKQNPQLMGLRISLPLILGREGGSTPGLRLTSRLPKIIVKMDILPRELVIELSR